jgi:hypothetical protein
MRFSMIRGGATAIAAAAAFAACSGHGIVPSQTLSNGVTTNAVGVAPNGLGDAPSPCNTPGLYYFQGSCKPFKMNMNTTTVVKLGQFGAYKGITINATLSKIQSPPKGVNNVAAIMADAIGKGDIIPPKGGKPFPLYMPGKPGCVNAQGKPETCPGKATFVYAELINQSTYKLTPVDTPGFYITDTNGYPGKTLCFPAILTTKGWAPNLTLGGKPNGHTLILVAAKNPGQLIFQPKSQFIVVGVCE